MGGINSKNRARIRRALLRRDGNYCAHCGEPMNEANYSKPRGLTIDHIYPLALGGSNRMSNLRLMHRRCNHALGGQLHQELSRRHYLKMFDHEGDF